MKTFMDWLSFTCGEQWKINDILKICQDRNEHTDRQRQSLTRHLPYIGLDTKVQYFDTDARY